jgi:hypothetical protein
MKLTRMQRGRILKHARTAGTEEAANNLIVYQQGAAESPILQIPVYFATVDEGSHLILGVRTRST